MMLANLPNMISLSRAVVGPVLAFGGLYLSSNWVMGLMWYAVLTDIIDGALARLLNAESEIGAKLDPWCDAFFVVGLMIYLTRVTNFSVLPTLAVLIRYVSTAVYHHDLVERGHRNLTSLSTGKCASTLVMMVVVYLTLWASDVRYPVLDLLFPGVLFSAFGMLTYSWGEYYQRYLRLYHAKTLHS